MWLRANVFHIAFDIYTLQSIKLQLTSYRADVFSECCNGVFWTVVGCCDTLCMLWILYLPYVHHV